MDKTRQAAERLEDIRPDHVKRYEFAAKEIPSGSHVLDIACGVGYGSWIMGAEGHRVTGVDVCQEAIDYAEKHYKGPTYLCQKAEDTKGKWDAIVTFETLEHLHDPERLLKAVRAPVLIASVPNEEHYPFKLERFLGDEYPHLRHYTPVEFEGLLSSAGYRVEKRYCQKDKVGDISEGVDGMFLIYVCT